MLLFSIDELVFDVEAISNVSSTICFYFAL